MTTVYQHTVENQHLDSASLHRKSDKTAASSRAHYLEQAGDLTVTNNFLKISNLVLVFALLASLAVSVGIVGHYRNMRPLVIRVDSVGKAEAVKYDDATYHPQENEMRYFVGQWAQLYYGRNHLTVHDDFVKSFYFVEPNFGHSLMQSHQQSKDVVTFINNASAPNTYIEINQIALDHLNQPPYAATVSFTAKQVAPYTDQVLSTTHYTTTLQFTFKPDIPAAMVPVNPLGFTVLAFHDQEAFN